MNTLSTYITSGIIEAYCLGNLTSAQAAEVSAMAAAHPEVQQEIDKTLAILEQYPQSPEPKAGLKDRVLGFLDAYLSAEVIDLSNPPLLHRFSDATAWNRALADLRPEIEEPGFAARILKETNEVVLSVVWLSDELVEDEHDPKEAFQESFFILEGSCECNFEGTIVRFSAGDYFDIPPNTKHIIKNISESLPYVKGLVQRRIAA
jgi:quercetin dioxygenase-like cupin family protein